MEDFVDDSKWLNLLAAELDYKQFPPAYAERIKNIRQILMTHSAALQGVENELFESRQEVDNLSKGLRIASADLEQLWLRFTICIKELAQHDPERAEAYGAYRPKLFDAFKPRV